VQDPKSSGRWSSDAAAISHLQQKTSWSPCASPTPENDTFAATPERVNQLALPVEEIARLAGHSSSRTTEVVYRRELRPVLTTGAEVMDKIFHA